MHKIMPFKFRWREILEYFTYLNLFILFVVWALPHTIALRNITLILGLLTALNWAIIARPRLDWMGCSPIIFLLLIPIWDLYHWYFLSELKDLQWKEISGTMVRCIFAAIFGGIAGLMLLKSPRKIIIIITAFTVLPVSTLFMYGYYGDIQEEYYGLYKGKFSEVYFVLHMVLGGFGLISSAIYPGVMKHKYALLFLGALLIAIGAGDFFIAHALNGFIVILIALLALIVFIGFYLASNQNSPMLLNWHSRFHLSLLVMICLLLASVYLYWSYDKIGDGKFFNLVGDVKVAMRGNDNLHWTQDGQNLIPLDSDGRPIKASTYQRVTWFYMGLELLKQNPLGCGITHQGFGHLMRTKDPNFPATITHSGWLDFSLGAGIPGLFLFWMAIIAAVFNMNNGLRGIEKLRAIGFEKNYLALQQVKLNIGIWVILGIFFYWIIGEVSEREYIEYYFFIISLFGLGARTCRFENS